MDDRGRPGLTTGVRLVSLGGLVGLLTGLVVGTLIWGDDEYWAALGVAFGGVSGCVVGVTCGLVVWLVRLWVARAPLAVPAAIGTCAGIALWALPIWINDLSVAWMVLASLPASARALAAASIASAFQR